ncbi:MAG: winged helix-turn-helix transcriptional regulator [Deltaproteobacteria bacterium]|nr:MAG: winged helix-turn-helix transcriptional regulator [Deltaproteobacteria bacterium]
MLKIISDPTRLKIMQFLHDGESCVSDIVKNIGTSQANVSKHLSLLTRVHLVKNEKRGQQVYYSISAPEVGSLCESICNHYGRLLKKYAI